MIFLNLFLLVDYKCFMYKNKKVDMEIKIRKTLWSIKYLQNIN